MRWLDRFLRDWRIRRALPHIPCDPSARVLDIGCLDRTLLHAISHRVREAVGVDPLAEPESFDNIRVLRGVVPGIDTGPSGLNAQGHPADRFDRITLLAVLEHVPDPSALAHACFDLLKPGGRVVITVPDPRVDHILSLLRRLRLIDGMSLEEHHGFASRQTPELFNAAGFRTIVAERFQLGLNNLFVFERPVDTGSALQSTVSSPAPASKARLSTLAVAFMALVVIARLLLVSHQEVATFGADDVTYTYISSGGYWGNPYTTYGFSRHPGYPLFMTACTVLGLPLRIGIEFFALAIAWTCAVGLRRLGVASALAAAAFTLISLHPHTIHLFSRVLPDTLYAPSWLLLAIGLAVASTAHTRGAAWRWGAIAGVGGAIGAITRAEGIMVPALVACAAAVVCCSAGIRSLSERGLTRRDRDASRFADCSPSLPLRTLAAIILPLAITLFTTTTLKLVTYREQGVFALADIDAPGFKRLFRRLLSITPDNPDPRLPVPLDVRTRARQASPTYNRLLTAMENDPSSMGYQNACVRTTGVTGEWGSWTIWAMRQGAWFGGENGIGIRWKNAAELDEFYATAADELEDAIDRGELQVRVAPVTFMPPDWGPLLSALPKSSRSVWLALVQPVYNRTAHEALSERQVRQFDATTLRRAELARLQSDRDFAPASFWHKPGTAERPGVVERLDRIKRTMARSVQVVTLACITIGLAGAFCAIAHGVLRPRSNRTTSTTSGRLHPWAFPMASLSAAMLILCAAVAGRLVLIALLDASGVPAQSRYTLPASLILPAVAAVGLQMALSAFRGPQHAE